MLFGMDLWFLLYLRRQACVPSAHTFWWVAPGNLGTTVIRSRKHRTNAIMNDIHDWAVFSSCLFSLLLRRPGWNISSFAEFSSLLFFHLLCIASWWFGRRKRGGSTDELSRWCFLGLEKCGEVQVLLFLLLPLLFVLYPSEYSFPNSACNIRTQEPFSGIFDVIRLLQKHL